MASNEKTSHRAPQKAKTRGAGRKTADPSPPTQLEPLRHEAPDPTEFNPAGFDPFSILPDNITLDEQAPVVTEPAAEYRAEPAPVAPTRKPMAPSIAKIGLNGNNMPANIGEGLHKELAKRREGRMSLFTPERAAEIVEGIENGKTMDEIAASVGVVRQTIWTWMQLSPEFSDCVAQAREFQGHASASDAVKILDDVEIDPNNPKASMAELRKAEQRARIRMELAKCFNFRQYGDKKQNMNLNVNAEVNPVDLSKYT